MAVVAGNTFMRILPGRRRVKYVVRAVRWAPVSYAEIEPVDGGCRATVPLHLVEQWVTQEQSVNERVLAPFGSVRAGIRRYSGGKGRVVSKAPSGDARKQPRR
ncbi:Uncharacterised protein [Mycobacteroides abscessus subsp. bolletii]|nr:Uncharacterised protein [Mycobacteroides abscessus subsp. bolletii]SKS36400.1 Uncharacterised protein [Mycobacteroides abscessus subsp. abscessus]SHW20992.1 Uncharacterised protein [Mycobacteroides abscessus subsp. bolletii]SHW49238.1 Uncharacterised protein [Mycobacteroides abscessus subsp. bolletii]SHX93505.1 Uncharacterised protein [Mycobacteroides abscessus subsp. bolletii]